MKGLDILLQFDYKLFFFFLGSQNSFLSIPFTHNDKWLLLRKLKRIYSLFITPTFSAQAISIVISVYAKRSFCIITSSLMFFVNKSLPSHSFLRSPIVYQN
jgi:hypothetical protein